MANDNKPAVVLYRPEIPPNTGNIIRLCANSGVDLHLIEPAFPLDDAKLRRAGLDYSEYMNLFVHQNWQHCQTYFSGRRIIAVETTATVFYHQWQFKIDDVLLFGSETKGLPSVITQLVATVKLPMQKHMRSLNLSNTVAIVVYETLRQNSFCSLEPI